MHHFLGRAGRAGSRPTCRRPTNPRVVVPRDEGTRVREERSTTLNLPEAHPPPKTWCPATEEQGFAGSEAPRSTCRRPIRPQRRGVPRRRSKGSRGVKHHARSAGGSTTQAVPHTHPRPKAHPVPSRPHPPGWRLSKPATASPMGRRPKSPNQWRGHGVVSLGGRRPQQAGTPIRPRLAGAHRRRTLPPAIAQPGAGGPSSPAPRPAAIAKPVNRKIGSCPRAAPDFYLHL